MIEAGRISPAPSTQQFAQDVRAGLCRAGQKALPPKYFYDDLGSILFDAITRLPEYGITRAEQRLLEAHADEIAQCAQATLAIELGSGSAAKTRCVLEAMLRRAEVAYCGVEISHTALALAQRALDDLRGLALHGVAADYLEGLDQALCLRPPHARVMLLFLGSSLGNFDDAGAHQFLRALRRALRPHDTLLLGNDLVKPESTLLAAYDDALGVTAAFNLNLLVRMNRELGADFSLARFRHQARFDPLRCDVEMHIVSTCDQLIRFRDAGFSVSLREGETIHTESSHKYSLAEIDDLASSSGFARGARWCDPEWPFASTLFVAV